MMLVDSSFKGDFYMIRKVNKPYTFKSQYLQNLSLTGKNDNNIIANDLDNVLMGNSGTNRFNGGKGEDVLQLRGKLSEYNIKINNGIAVIEDTVKNRDGVNIMVNIETIRATDKDYEINK
jgi:Ca2+-binding RTX toxin-like protein